MRSVLTLRIAAKVVDIVLAVQLAYWLGFPLGFVLANVYVLFSDSFFHKRFRGKSLGKKIFKLKVLRSPSMQIPRPIESFMRNAPIGVVMFFGLIPFWGWVLALILGIPLLLIETYLLFKTPQGARIGDVMAGTIVIKE